MSHIKKNIPIISTAAIILVLLLALFYAIYLRLDGFSIFSIMLGIIFFSFISYKINGHQNADADSGGTITNMSHALKIVTSPMFIRLLPTLLTVIFSYLEKHKEKLSNHVTQELQREMQEIINKFKSNELGSHEDSDHANGYKVKK